MRNCDYSYKYQNNAGFTLVEILIALVLLLLIITACFPLLSLAAKITNETRTRLIASELAKREMERTLALVTADNYIGEAEGAPLKTGISELYYFADDGTPIADRDPNSRFAKFEARKIVGWIDDPADNVHPDDNTPFDYKVLTIEVFCPSLFTGAVSRKADFKTFVAREGATSALTGVIVEVVRGWTDENGKRVPVEGVTVNLEGYGFSPDALAQTNRDGVAMIPLVFVNDSDVYSYNIQLEYPGMIPRPGQNSTTEARPYTTSYIQMEMENPASLKVLFAPAQNKCTVTLKGIGMDPEGTKKTIFEGDTSLTFSNLWPAGSDPANPLRACDGGTYNLKVDSMLIYSLALDSGEGQVGPEKFELHGISNEEKNLWMYHVDLDGNGPAWRAAAANYAPGIVFFDDENKHRMATLAPDEADNDLINLALYKPVSPGVTASLSGSIKLELSGYSSLPDDFSLLYLGKKEAKIDEAEGWETFLKIASDADGKRVLLDHDNKVVIFEEEDDKLKNPEGISFPTPMPPASPSLFFDEPFRLRFDSRLDSDPPPPEPFVFLWRSLVIKCAYEKEISFTQPGHNVLLRISGKEL